MVEGGLHPVLRLYVAPCVSIPPQFLGVKVTRAAAEHSCQTPQTEGGSLLQGDL